MTILSVGLQICESAGFSMSMVVRYALGLSAKDGRILVIPGDNLAGLVAIATARQLFNSGTEPIIIEIETTSQKSEIFQKCLQSLRRDGIILEKWTDRLLTPDFISLLSSCHNVICGLHDHRSQSWDTYSSLVEILNNQSIPVHAIHSPLGVDVNTGLRAATPLFASSTLSLGIPYCGLAVGHEYSGRHYLCDISVSRNIYKELNITDQYLFSEQPVIRIYSEEELSNQEGSTEIEN